MWNIYGIYNLCVGGLCLFVTVFVLAMVDAPSMFDYSSTGIEYNAALKEYQEIKAITLLVLFISIVRIIVGLIIVLVNRRKAKELQNINI